MKEKVLIFIPYQDTDNFYSEGIMTREYAILYILWKEGYKAVINIKKPRTWLDKKRYGIKDEHFPEGTIEYQIKNILDSSPTIQYLPPISYTQITKRRGWWIDGYQKTTKRIFIDKEKDYLVYSNNPYAEELLNFLSQKGCKVFFDIMDNFAIHPSLTEDEHSAALVGYKRILQYADYISANSQQTCDFMKRFTNKTIHLVKNGVFANNEIESGIMLDEVEAIQKKKAHFRTCAGYIGKLGQRLDADLIDEISRECKDILFVFVGGYLKGQINEKLMKLFEDRDNVLHIDAVPSAYVYPILNEFDILLIPHAVGKAENGGDPLKLYQYLTRNKPIITTPILGVDEFKSEIQIVADSSEWIDRMKLLIDNDIATENRATGFYWEERIKPIITEINESAVGENK